RRVRARHLRGHVQDVPARRLRRPPHQDSRLPQVRRPGGAVMELTPMSETDTEFAPEPAMTPVMQWAAEARQVALIAESLARTSFVPKAFAGKPAEVTAAIMAGQEIGLQPVAALRSIDVIQG